MTGGSRGLDSGALRVVVLVPRRAGNPYRDEVWAWVRGWWESEVGFPIVEGNHDVGPFNRSAAINRAAADAGAWDVAVIIDADVLLDPIQIHAAVGAAAHTGGPVLGYTERIHLHKAGTREVLDGYRGDWRPFTRTRLLDSCSSLNVVTRDLFAAVHGFDEIFNGWGWEDVGFRIATELVSGRNLVKIDGTLWHLWHPKSPENDTAQETFQANRSRGDLYKAARRSRDVEAVMALVTETLP